MSLYLELENIDSAWSKIEANLTTGMNVREPFTQSYGMKEFHLEIPFTKTLLLGGTEGNMNLSWMVMDADRNNNQAIMIHLREALERSSDTETAYLGVFENGNPALGQCYSTSRVVQLFSP